MTLYSFRAWALNREKVEIERKGFFNYYFMYKTHSLMPYGGRD